MMGAGHKHARMYGGAASGRRSRLRAALILTAIYTAAEAAGGWLTNSLALLADAGHMLTDVAALSLTLFALWFSAKPATEKKTYGYYRIEILAAFVNGVVLAVLSLSIIYEAIQRLGRPTEILGAQMTLVAIGGLLVNIAAAYLLSSHHQNDLNLRGAWLHVIGDLLGSVAAIAAGLAVTIFGWLWADPVGSMAISLIIIVGAIRLVLESADILLEGTPRHIDLRAVESAILQTKGVDGAHDLHIWTISSGIEALSVHVTHSREFAHTEVLARLRKELHDKFGIDHLTIQMETLEETSRNGEEGDEAKKIDEALFFCDGGERCFETRTGRQRRIELSEVK